MTTVTNDSVDAIAERVRKITESIRAEAVERELSTLTPEPRVRALAEAGLGRVRLPVEFGGAGGSVSDLLDLLVPLAAADSNFVQIFRGHFGFVEFLIDHERSSARDELLYAIGRGEIVGPAASVPPSGQPNGGKAPSVIIDSSTTLRKEGEQALLSGTKYYTTGSLYADWIAVAVVQENGVKEVLIRRDDPGVTVDDDWGGFGQRLTASGTTTFDDVVVREGYTFSRDDTAIDSYLGAFYQFIHSTTQAGIIQRSVEDLADVVRNRKRSYPLATTDSPHHDPEVLQTVGDVATAQFGARASTETLARTFDRYLEARDGADPDDVLTEVIVASAQTQVLNTRLAGEATWELFNAASASATNGDQALDRHWRNARTISSHNPVIYKARLVGDFTVNGSVPDVHRGFGARR